MGDQPCRKCGGSGVKRQRGIVRPLIRGAVASGVQEMDNRFNNNPSEPQTVATDAPAMTADGRPVPQQQYYDNERSSFNTGLRTFSCR